MADIRNLEETILSNGWTELSLCRFEMKMSDGSWHGQKREIYKRGNAVCVLPYNAKTQSILLVRQLRMPVYSVHEDPMILEVCAGIIDEGEDAILAVLREMKEELGYCLKNPVAIFEGFVSPGYSTEKLTLYLAEYDDSCKQGKGGGLPDEGEEIEIVEVLLSRAMQKLAKGDIKDLKTAFLLSALQNRIEHK